MLDQQLVEYLGELATAHIELTKGVSAAAGTLAKLAESLCESKRARFAMVEELRKLNGHVAMLVEAARSKYPL